MLVCKKLVDSSDAYDIKYSIIYSNNIHDLAKLIKVYTNLINKRKNILGESAKPKHLNQNLCAT